MKISLPKFGFSKRANRGFCLEEVVTSIAISGISVAGIISGYILAAERAEWAAISAAANQHAMQRVEQTKAAKWDPAAATPIDELNSANFPSVVQALNIPRQGTNLVYGTNVTTITTLSANPPLRMVKSETTWKFLSRGIYTNTIITYRSPDS